MAEPLIKDHVEGIDIAAVLLILFLKASSSVTLILCVLTQTQDYI